MKWIEETVVEILGDEKKSQKRVCEDLERLYGIKMSTRSLRKVYEGIRDAFVNKEINFTVLACAEGNYISYDFEAIKKDNEASRKTAIAILKNAYARDKRIRFDDQMTFAEYVVRMEREYIGD